MILTFVRCEEPKEWKFAKVYKLEETRTDYKVWTAPSYNTPTYISINTVLDIKYEADNDYMHRRGH